jgi:acetyl esterase
MQAVPVAAPPGTLGGKSLPVGPTGATRVRIVRARGAAGQLPIVMWFHGGGWMLGDEVTHDRLIREIACGAEAAVVFVLYDRTPEAKYPVALEQAYAATRFVAEHAAALDLDGARLAVAGDSVGGNLAAVVCLLAKERHGPAICFQLLYCPVTDSSFEEPSYATFADGPFLTRRRMAWYWDHYLPDREARRQPTASPLQASLAQLRGLPRALVIVDENDVLRDEGEAYAKKLGQAGVRAASTCYTGTIHDFVMLNPLAGTPAVRAAVLEGSRALRDALHGG